MGGFTQDLFINFWNQSSSRKQEINLQISSRTNLHSKSKNSSCHPPLFHKRKEERKMKVEQWSSKNDFRNQQNEDEKKIGNHTSWAFLSFLMVNDWQETGTAIIQVSSWLTLHSPM